MTGRLIESFGLMLWPGFSISPGVNRANVKPP